MITVIHGDDVAASRNFLHNIKEKSPNYRTLQGSAVDLTTLTQIFESESLFGPKETIIIESLLTNKNKSADLDAVLLYLSKQAAANDMYLWEGKEIAKTTLNKLGKASVQLFKLPQSLFQFLDSLSPKNTRQALQLFNKTIQTAEVEIVFYMLIRHFRLLLALSDGEAEIDEVKRLSPWQKTKLKKQAATFTKEQLKQLYIDLHKIDYNQKTGGAAQPLVSSIDIFLMSL